MPARKYDRITQPQLKALKKYYEEHGRYWKRVLKYDWKNERAGVLQWLRTTHGDDWLKEFKFGRPDVQKE